jgi:dTDP-4-dehydrorhamnose reductase
MHKSVFFTGGSGLLALNWATTIRESHAVTLGLHERDVALAGVATRRSDLESIEQVVRTLEAVCPDVLIHTAGLTNVAQCEAKPDLAHHVNVELAANVAQACAQLQIALVHISTDQLFLGEQPMVPEQQPAAPKNVYAATKAEAESRVLAAHPQALVIRTNFYGWGTSYRSSFSDMVLQALRSRQELTLYQDVFYTPILIDAAVTAVHDLLARNASGVFNVVGDERVSKLDFGLRLAREFALDTSIIKFGFMADQTVTVQRPYDMSLSNQKVCTLLGKRLGGLSDQLSMLHRQEQIGLAQELRTL